MKRIILAALVGVPPKADICKADAKGPLMTQSGPHNAGTDCFKLLRPHGILSLTNHVDPVKGAIPLGLPSQGELEWTRQRSTAQPWDDWPKPWVSFAARIIRRRLP